MHSHTHTQASAPIYRHSNGKRFQWCNAKHLHSHNESKQKGYHAEEKRLNGFKVVYQYEHTKARV